MVESTMTALLMAFLTSAPAQCNPNPPAGNLVAIQPVVRQAPSGLDQASGSPPASDANIPLGNFVIEMWAQQLQTGGSLGGLLCVFADLTFDGADMTCNNRVAAPNFSTFATGTCQTNGVDELGGCTLIGGAGITPQWVRIATVNMSTDALSVDTIAGSAAGMTSTSIFGCGNVPAARIDFRSFTFDIVQPCTSDPECNDGLFCNGVETCDMQTGCQPGDDPCTNPNLPFCNEAIDQCVECLVTADCDDGLVCNGAETCVNNVCQTGTPPCNDGVACTVDSCNEISGCSNTPNNFLCSDPLFCTGDRTCHPTLGCQNGPSPCTDPNFPVCNEANDTCVECLTDADCDDGVFCNGQEDCVANVCQPGTAPCAPDPCDSINDVCTIPCTIEPNDPVCDDGIACTSDVCSGGICLRTPNDNLCADTIDCTVDTCENGIGCVFTPTHSLCEDSVSCTIDQCNLGAMGCIHIPVNSLCANGQFCDGSEVCHTVNDCQPGPFPCNDNVSCTTNDCNEITDQCVFTPNCDDGVACTIDTCSGPLNMCFHTPDDAACSDGLFCNGLEVCNPASGCQAGNPPVCNDGVICTTDSCNEITDECVNTPNCNDGVPCTLDVCSPVLNDCFNIPNHGVCSDGVFCNGSEVCNTTVGCQASPPPNCSDGVDCTVDTCNAGTDSCVSTPDHALCDDGLWCTGTETCNPAAGCENGTAVVCDDAVACTADSCDDNIDQCVFSTECQATFLRVNLQWRNVTINGDQVTAELFAAPQGNPSFTHLVAGISAVVTWDPEQLELLPLVNNSPYPWSPSSFPDDSGADDLNAGVLSPPVGLPDNDGDALYEAQGQFPPPLGVGPAIVPAAGLRIATFKFQMVAPELGVDTVIEIAETYGQSTCTRVFFGGFGYQCVGNSQPCNPQDATPDCFGKPQDCQPIGSVPNCDIKNDLGQFAIDITAPCLVDCGDEDGNNVTDDNCIYYECSGTICNESDRLFADAGSSFGNCPPDGFVNLFDRNHALTCFAGTNLCNPINLDIGGAFGNCNPDGFCNLFDANHVLTAFAGTNVCSCPANAAPEQIPAPVGSAGLVVEAEQELIKPGGTVSVRVFLDEPLDDLQSYQLHLGVSGGRRGTLELVDVTVEDRRDAAFAGTRDRFEAFNLHTAQMLSGLEEGGVGTAAGAYLATFTYRATDKAMGQFVIDARHGGPDGQTFLVSNFSERIAVQGVEPAVITVAGPMKTSR